MVDQPTAEAMLRALDRFVGEWTMAAGPPGGPPWPGGGRMSFGWLEGGAFLIQRWSVERGVCRVYEMDLDDNQWTLRRGGAPFAQRFTGTFSEDGRTITGRWELAEDGEHWRTDFDITYTKVA